MSFFETETSSRNKNLLAIGISLSNIFKIQTEVNPLKTSSFKIWVCDDGFLYGYQL